MSLGVRLYYDDPFLDACDAVVVGISGDGRLVELDRTLFYPEGGGQPCDLGTVGGLPLERVLEREGRVLHGFSDRFGPAVGATVRLVLDRGRRRDHSEQHSAQHLISGLAFRDFGIPTKSFHLGPQTSTVDLDSPGLPAATLSSLEASLEASIVAATPFVTHLCPPEDPATLPLRRPPPVGEQVIRVIEIAGLDHSPCCGTHVTDASGLRFVTIVTTERYKGMTRLSFVAGGRAAALAARVHRSAQAAGRILSAAPDLLGPEAEALAARLRTETVRTRGLLRAYVAIAIDLPARATPPREGPETMALPLVRLPGTDTVLLEAGLDEGLREFAARGLRGLILAPGILTATVATGGLPVAEGDRNSPDVTAALGDLSRGLGGRGGGGKGSFRAAFRDPGSFEAFAAGAAALLSAGS
jgi:alanyl-tRNA synthetase